MQHTIPTLSPSAARPVAVRFLFRSALLLVGVLALAVATGCASGPPRLEHQTLVPDLGAATRGQSYALRADAEEQVHARIVAEFASSELAGDLSLLSDAGAAAATTTPGTLDVLFTTTPDAITDGHYSGWDSRRSRWGSANYNERTRYYAKSVTMMTLRDATGKRLWTALHRGWEATEVDAARVAIHELAVQLRADLAAGPVAPTAPTATATPAPAPATESGTSAGTWY